MGPCGGQRDQRNSVRWSVAEVAGRALSNMSDELGLPDDALGAYFRAVQAASPWNQALTMITDEAAKLAAKNAALSSAVA
jgi:hypothetical protein